MSQTKMRLTLVALGLFCLSGLAHAQSPKVSPLFSPARLSVAVGANYAWHSGAASAIPDKFQKEVEVGVYGAYALTSYQNAAGVWKPRLVLVASSLYGLDTKGFHTSLGVRLPVFVGAE